MILITGPDLDAMIAGAIGYCEHCLDFAPGPVGLSSQAEGEQCDTCGRYELSGLRHAIANGRLGLKMGQGTCFDSAGYLIDR